jgi:hypothetical protein
MSLVRTSYVMHKVGVRVPLERRHVRQLCRALSKWTMVVPRPLLSVEKHSAALSMITWGVMDGTFRKDPQFGGNLLVLG